MSQTNETFIREYPNRLSNEQCKMLIKFFDDSPNTHNGKTYGPNNDIKVSTDLEVHPENDAEIDDLIFNMMATVFNDYTKEFDDNLEFMNSYNGRIWKDTGYQFQMSPKNKGKFDWHSDSSFGKAEHICNRHFAIIVYLNDVNSGGETEFMYQKTSIKPEVGKVIVFPSYPQWLHRGVIPKSNDKYIITTFMTQSINQN